MADHNTLIGSAAGEIEGGTVRLNGAYELESGTVLVNGVAQEIAFGSKVTTITTSGIFATNNAYVKIGDRKITRAETGEYEKPVTITAYAKTTGNQSKASSIVLNGVTVASGSGATAAQYSFTTEADTVTITSQRTLILGTSYYYYTITITEE